MPERQQRFENSHDLSNWSIQDRNFANKIWKLLGARKDIYKDDVDALYFDYSVIPRHLNLCRDSYLIYGITEEGEFVSKWIDRWTLDSDD